MIFTTLLFFFLSSPSLAGSLDGVDLPDQQLLGAQALVLNGMGTRKATLFKVKVYVAGLYVTSRSSDAQVLLNSKDVKRLDMKFVRNVDRDDIQKAWTKSFSDNCDGPSCADLMKNQVPELIAAMEDMKSGDTMTYLFYPDGLELQVKGKPHPKIVSPELSRWVLACWIGKNPPNEELKEGLLGKR